MGEKICPKCKSTNVRKDLNVLLAMGVPQNWICNKCGYYGYIFPEKDIKTKNKKK